MDVLVLVAVLRHLGEQNDDEHGHDDQSDSQIGRDEHREVGFLHRVELFTGEVCTLCRRHRIKPRLDEIHGHIHADDGAAGIEALGHVQAPRGGLLASHREDVGVAGGLEERESAGHDEIGDEETAIHAHHLRGEEEQRARGIKPEAHQHARLVRELADEHRGGEGHAEIAAVEGHLHQRTFGDAHAENLGESLHHRVRDVVGKAPKREAEGHEDEGDEIAGRDYGRRKPFRPTPYRLSPLPLPVREGSRMIFRFSTHGFYCLFDC